MSKHYFKRRKHKEEIEIAKERISILWNRIKENPESKYVTNYSNMIRKISKSYRLYLPESFNKKICKKCGIYLIPGKNCKVRISKKSRIIICKCGEAKIFKY